MRIERILEIDAELGQEMLDLIGTIDDPEMDVQAFIDYFVASLSEIGVFGLFDDEHEGDKLVAMTYAEAPTRIYPRRAYLFLTAAYPGTNLSNTRILFNITCDWAMSHGATYFWGWTERSPRVINRIYGFKVVKEKQVICPLTGNDHLNVKLDERYQYE